MGRISHFSSPSLVVDREEGKSLPGNRLVKKALLLVSGSHKDSKKRPHTFEVDRIEQIADNTNRVLSEYGRIPLIKDHNKTSDSTIGDLEGEVYTKVITREDLPDPRLTDLIGKVGIFTDNLVVKSKQAIQGFVEGIHRTISPGIDVDTDEIREISVTPLPAIKGLMAFHRGDSLRKFALTLEEAEQETDDLDQLKEQFEELGDLFWTVVESVSSAEEDALQGADPRELLFQAVNDYTERVIELLQLNQEEEVAEDPYATQGQGYPTQRSFSMSGREDMAEFAMRGNRTSPRPTRSAPRNSNRPAYRPVTTTPARGGALAVIPRRVNQTGAIPSRTSPLLTSPSALASTRRGRRVKVRVGERVNGTITTPPNSLARRPRSFRVRTPGASSATPIVPPTIRSNNSSSAIVRSPGGGLRSNRPGTTPLNAKTIGGGRKPGFFNLRNAAIGGGGLAALGAGYLGYRALTGGRKKKMTITRNY